MAKFKPYRGSNPHFHGSKTRYESPLWLTPTRIFSRMSEKKKKKTNFENCYVSLDTIVSFQCDHLRFIYRSRGRIKVVIANVITVYRGKRKFPSNDPRIYIDRAKIFINTYVSRRIINLNWIEGHGLKRMKFRVTKFNFYLGGSANRISDIVRDMKIL